MWSVTTRCRLWNIALQRKPEPIRQTPVVRENLNLCRKSNLLEGHYVGTCGDVDSVRGVGTGGHAVRSAKRPVSTPSHTNR